MNLTKNDVIGKTCYEITHNTSTPCQPPNDTCPIQEVLETGVPVKVEHVHIDKDNHERIVEVFARPVNNPEGKTVIIHVASDVTERKKAEAKNKEDSIRIEIMNEKLRVVGGLSRHDVRNKLFLVTGNMYLLKKKYSAHKDIMDSIEKIEQAVKDSMKIFEFAKMYEQLGVEKLFYIDVEKALNEAVALFSDLRFKVINNCLGLTVLADSFLRQLFYNLIDNTKKYGKKTTTIRLFYEKVRPGELRLIYEDDGVGISTENKLKLFTEGFSTGGSTGFGLYLIKKMVDIYGWSVKETGEPNKGVKFAITIPQFNQSGKENFHIKARYDSKSKIDKSSYLVHISNSQETYSQANDNSRGMVHLDGSIGDELVE